MGRLVLKILPRQLENVDPEELAIYKAKAGEDMKRYKREMETYVAETKDSTGVGKPNQAAAGLTFPLPLQSFRSDGNKKQRLEDDMFRLDG